MKSSCHLSYQWFRVICKSLQRSCDLTGPCSDGEGILSPLDEDSFADSEHTITSPTGPPTTEYISHITTDNDVEGDY